MYLNLHRQAGFFHKWIMWPIVIVTVLSICLAANAMFSKESASGSIPSKVIGHDLSTADVILNIRNECDVTTTITTSEQLQVRLICDDEPVKNHAWNMNAVGKSVVFRKTQQEADIRLHEHAEDGIDWKALNATLSTETL